MKACAKDQASQPGLFGYCWGDLTCLIMVRAGIVPCVDADSGCMVFRGDMSGLLRYNKNMTFLDSLDIAPFCKRWKIREFAIFGSILRDDFKPESDVDVLVTFSQAAEWGLFDHVQMRNELESLLGRKVDLVTRRALEQTQNHILRERITNSAKVIFSEDEAAYAEG